MSEMALHLGKRPGPLPKNNNPPTYMSNIHDCFLKASQFVVWVAWGRVCQQQVIGVFFQSVKSSLHPLSSGLSARLTSFSLWCASSPQRAWRAAAELAGWFAWLKRSSAASLAGSPPPSSRRPWRSTRSSMCGRSTRLAAASRSSD